jgi:hypothetical protein
MSATCLAHLILLVLIILLIFYKVYVFVIRVYSLLIKLIVVGFFVSDQQSYVMKTKYMSILIYAIKVADHIVTTASMKNTICWDITPCNPTFRMITLPPSTELTSETNKWPVLLPPVYC